MREQFDRQLDSVQSELVEMTHELRDLLATATAALLEADRGKSEEVISGEVLYATRLDQIEDRVLVLLATQQPVASDLRQLMAGIRIVVDLKRAGHNGVHIAQIARRRLPHVAVPDALVSVVEQMSQVADTMIVEAARLVAEKDPEAVVGLDRIDDRMDALQRDLYRKLLAEGQSFDIEDAMDISLLGRYYERVADHVVNLARRVTYQVTGERITLS